MFLLICSFSWCLLKSKEERNCNIKIARNYYHSRGNNWQLFLVDIPRTIFLWLLYSHVVTSQNRHGYISYLSRENCVNWTTLLHSILFDFIEMQTLTFQIRFFLPHNNADIFMGLIFQCLTFSQAPAECITDGQAFALWNHTIRKVKFLSTNSILAKPQHFHEFFGNFSCEIKVVNS